MPQGVCFRCGQTRHVKKYFPLLNNIGFVGQSSAQPSPLFQSFGKSIVQPAGSSRFMVGSSFGTQGVQRPQRTQTGIFAMIADETQANSDRVTSIIFVFGTPTHILFDSRSSRSFMSSSFALHVNRDSSGYHTNGRTDSSNFSV